MRNTKHNAGLLLGLIVGAGCTGCTTRTTSAADGGGAGAGDAAGRDAGSHPPDGGGCVYQGKHYVENETFPASDGCNTCSCSAGGQVACTKKACFFDAGMSDAGQPDAHVADAGSCTPTKIARLCVRGTMGGTDEPVAVGDPLRVMVYPQGCFSSSCTRAEVATCAVTGSSSFVVNGQFCLRNTGGPMTACTADCGGGGFASCESTTKLTAGSHTVMQGGLSVTFTVPSRLPLAGQCDGQQF